ncbi:hypothetical protein SARC_09586 [Sphaeroforma arctica JP610]|uniref:COX assembly mitochondrial protein n=1 Tax=Sphaeroforma arctica JP610 TaxID=667725 RepID=A0A0L0FMG6_9EUKA|nr:hypothetical protein SARC_09586 [Sphaeroforma arctica JP610]KNC77964.1 hypothetical protein SARC_09586 [Sphaeroforma arctica JP610]|eukprot:XP_014151866.1 hypothetical protein SARC_09586 [Sphaeroforma arctica JP610]
MHPQLARHVHPTCQDAIDALEACHRENSFRKFLGECNDAKTQLDRCLYDEYKVEQKRNLAESRRRRTAFKANMKESQEAGEE